jgi:hypothetical protein
MKFSLSGFPLRIFSFDFGSDGFLKCVRFANVYSVPSEVMSIRLKFSPREQVIGGLRRTEYDRQPFPVSFSFIEKSLCCHPRTFFVERNFVVATDKVAGMFDCVHAQVGKFFWHT